MHVPDGVLAASVAALELVVVAEHPDAAVQVELPRPARPGQTDLGLGGPTVAADVDEPRGDILAGRRDHHHAHADARSTLARRELARRERLAADQHRRDTQPQVAHAGTRHRTTVLTDAARGLAPLVGRRDADARLPTSQREHATEGRGDGVDLGLHIRERRGGVEHHIAAGVAVAEHGEIGADRARRIRARFDLLRGGRRQDDGRQQQQRGGVMDGGAAAPQPCTWIILVAGVGAGQPACCATRTIASLVSK